MRTLTAAELTQIRGDFTTYYRVWVRNADNEWVDITQLGLINWITDLDWGGTVDQPLETLNVTVRREAQGYSLAPEIVASQFNRNAVGLYAPLLYAGRGWPAAGGIKLEQASIAPTAILQASDWKEVFLGKIDEVNDGDGGMITLVCRDLGGYLLDTEIEDVKTYSTDQGLAVETVTQQILDDTLGIGAVTLSVPQSPGWIITSFEQSVGPLLTGLRNLWSQIGWELRYVYNAAGVSRLTGYNPRATKALPDVVMSADEYLAVRALHLGDADIRNVVRVFYTVPTP